MHTSLSCVTKRAHIAVPTATSHTTHTARSQSVGLYNGTQSLTEPLYTSRDPISDDTQALTRRAKSCPQNLVSSFPLLSSALTSLSAFTSTRKFSSVLVLHGDLCLILQIFLVSVLPPTGLSPFGQCCGVSVSVSQKKIHVDRLVESCCV